MPFWDDTLWQVAWHGDEPVGMVLNFIRADENARFGGCAATPNTSTSPELGGVAGWRALSSCGASAYSLNVG